MAKIIKIVSLLSAVAVVGGSASYFAIKGTGSLREMFGVSDADQSEEAENEENAVDSER